MLDKTTREAKISYYTLVFGYNRSNLRHLEYNLEYNKRNIVLNLRKRQGLKSIISNGKTINDIIDRNYT